MRPGLEPGLWAIRPVPYTLGMLEYSHDLKYPSRREPIYASNVVATGQPLAAQAGLDIIRRGGNAFDAIVATAACLPVVEPTSNGLGSDAFALIWAGGGLHGLNASGRSPALMTPDRYEGMTSIPYRGWDGVTTPGCVSAWVAIAEEHGTMPLADLLEPAARYAEHGYPVSPITSYYWGRSVRAYSKQDFPEWNRVFAPSGKAPEPGEIATLPDHASTLREIGETNGKSYYEGRLADAIDKASREGGGALRRQDLVEHQADWVRPISVDYRGFHLHEIPPNGQGIAALIALGILANFDLASMDPDSADTLHLQIEAMKLAFRDTHRYVADERFMEIDPQDLLDPAYHAQRAKLIDRKKATDFKHGTPKPGGTVYLTASDAMGNMVSYIQSNYTGFGSGIVVPGTGISLQNRGCCFSLEENHPNRVGPKKRPYHTIIPGFVTRVDKDGNHEPIMSFGVMGGFMQPQGHLQVLCRIADWQQNPQSALDAPRWQIADGMQVSIEPAFGEPVISDLRSRGHAITVTKMWDGSFGRGQIIAPLRDPSQRPMSYVAASEPRTDGQAVGF